jgi:glycosyltransferase involved in cell wall biosynthesis
VSGCRVLIIVENCSVPADRRVWDECRSLRQAGFTVSVICPRREGEAAHEELEGVRLHRYRQPPESRSKLGFLYEYGYSWVRTAGLTVRLLVTEGFDVLQACNPPDSYFLLAWPLKVAGKQFVFDQHDLSPELYVARFGERGVLLPLVRVFERATYATADHVITANRWYRDIAIERGGKRPDQVTVVRNGPDLTRMRRQPAVRELKEGKALLCCFLGVIERHDGVDLALQAIHHLVFGLGRRNCHFAFLGDGDSLPEVRLLAHDLALDDWVTFTGWADDAMIKDYLSTADVGLQPDPKDPRIDISTATKTMEYMAFGLPVVAFDLRETRESARDAAVYARPNDVTDYARRLDDLLSDPARRADMGASGRRYVKRELGWHHQSLAYVGVYTQMLRPATVKAVGRRRRGQSEHAR